MLSLPDLRVRQRDSLLEIARALTEELDLEVLLGRILNISVDMLACKAGVIALRSETGEWHMAVHQGLPPAFVRFIDPILAKIPENDDPANFELPEINRVLQELTYNASLGLLSGVGLPLITRQKVVGVIFIFRGYMDNFSANDRALLSSFANQAAIAVQNAQLYSQISHQKQRLDALLEVAADGILILTPDLKIERSNHAFERMINLHDEEIQSKSHEEMIVWIAPPHELTLEQAVAGGWPLSPHATLYVEGDLQRPNGQLPLPVGITYSPLFEDEHLRNIIATVRDISRFRQADELKSTFISIISHELKTPVALIKGYVSTLRLEDANWEPEIVNESLKVIEEEADRLSMLIENLLDASRLQAGGLSLKRADVSIPELARRTAVRLQTQTSRHHITVDFPFGFPILLADETRLQQVLSNLISNAIKYSPEGEIRISGQVRPDFVQVCVSDEGPGIDSEDMPRVFDRFYRGSEVARQTKGAGLGLFLTRSIIEAHGGRIWVDPETNRGARICFTLPITHQLPG